LHVATVYDKENAELRLYLDGQVIAQRAITPLPIRINRDQELYLGRYGGADAHRFPGMIDELRIVGEAIDFTGRPEKPYLGTEAHTVALYHFDGANEESRLI